MVIRSYPKHELNDSNLLISQSCEFCECGKSESPIQSFHLVRWDLLPDAKNTGGLYIFLRLMWGWFNLVSASKSLHEAN